MISKQKQHHAKGWCPSTLTPMMSGDGLLVRIKPAFNRLTSKQVAILASLSDSFGNGIIDITNRANLQIRGVTHTHLSSLIDALFDSGLTKNNEAYDKLNLTLAPFTSVDSLGWRCACALYDEIVNFPNLPAKFGFAVDCGSTRTLCNASADIRLETNKDGQLIIRLDGSENGFITDENTFLDDIKAVLNWYLLSQKYAPIKMRMKQFIIQEAIHETWCTTQPQASMKNIVPGTYGEKQVIAAPFGQLTSDQLAHIASVTDEVIMCLDRCLLIDKTADIDSQFITSEEDIRRNISVCAGMPACTGASINTRKLATKIISRLDGAHNQSYHISGCAKGCATKTSRDICIIGNDGNYGLLENGCAWDSPDNILLSEAALFDELDRIQKN